MNIRREKEFTPITITLESKDELRCLVAAMNVSDETMAVSGKSYGYSTFNHGNKSRYIWERLNNLWDELK